MLTPCKKFMHTLTLEPMPKLNTVLGFRPTDDELDAVLKAEEATGRNRSDILRACFHYAGKAVVSAMKAQRDAAASAFDSVMSQSSPMHDQRTHTASPKDHETAHATKTGSSTSYLSAKAQRRRGKKVA